MVVFIGLLPAQATTSTLQSLQAPIRLKLLCRSESCSPEPHGAILKSCSEALHLTPKPKSLRPSSRKPLKHKRLPSKERMFHRTRIPGVPGWSAWSSQIPRTDA